MDLSHSRPGDKEGGPGIGPPGGLLGEQVCGVGWRLGAGAPGPKPGPALGGAVLPPEPWSRPPNTLFFPLGPQIEPPPPHFSPEEVRIGVLGGLRVVLGSSSASS